MLAQCWASVADADPTLSQHCLDVAYFLDTEDAVRFPLLPGAVSALIIKWAAGLLLFVVK